MDSTFMRIIILGLGLLLGINLMGCSSQDMSGSKSSAAPTPSFAQFNDIPFPSGASMDMDRSLLLGSAEEWTGRLVYTTGKDAASMFDLYKSDMPRFGWTELTSIRGERSFMTYQRGSRVATVEIKSRTLYGSTVSITMSPMPTGGSAPASSYSAPSTYGSSSSSSGGAPVYSGGASSGSVTRSPLQ